MAGSKSVSARPTDRPPTLIDDKYCSRNNASSNGKKFLIYYINFRFIYIDIIIIMITMTTFIIFVSSSSSSRRLTAMTICHRRQMALTTVGLRRIGHSLDCRVVRQKKMTSTRPKATTSNEYHRRQIALRLHAFDAEVVLRGRGTP